MSTWTLSWGLLSMELCAGKKGTMAKPADGSTFEAGNDAVPAFQPAPRFTVYNSLPGARKGTGKWRCVGEWESQKCSAQEPSPDILPMMPSNQQTYMQCHDH